MVILLLLVVFLLFLKDWSIMVLISTNFWPIEGAASLSDRGVD